MLVFLFGVFLKQRRSYLSAPMRPAASATSPSLAQAEEEAELHVAQRDLQCVIEGPEESKATQQEQELEEKAQEGGNEPGFSCWATGCYQLHTFLLILVSDDMWH